MLILPSRPGARLEFKESLGILMPAPTSTASTSGGGWSVLGDIRIGTPIVIAFKMIATGDGSVTSLVSKPVLETSFFIVDAWAVIRTRRSGGNPNHLLQVTTGDGADPEVFDVVTDAHDMDDLPNGQYERFEVWAKDGSEWASGHSLRCLLNVSGGTTGGTAEIDCCVMAIPVI